MLAGTSRCRRKDWISNVWMVEVCLLIRQCIYLSLLSLYNDSIVALRFGMKVLWALVDNILILVSADGVLSILCLIIMNTVLNPILILQHRWIPINSLNLAQPMRLLPLEHIISSIMTLALVLVSTLLLILRISQHSALILKLLSIYSILRVLHDLAIWIFVWVILPRV